MELLDRLLLYLKEQHEAWDEHRKEFIHDVQNELLDFLEKEYTENYYNSFKD